MSDFDTAFAVANAAARKEGRILPRLHFAYDENKYGVFVDQLANAPQFFEPSAVFREALSLIHRIATENPEKKEPLKYLKALLQQFPILATSKIIDLILANEHLNSQLQFEMATCLIEAATEQNRRNLPVDALINEYAGDATTVTTALSDLAQALNAKGDSRLAVAIEYLQTGIGRTRRYGAKAIIDLARELATQEDNRLNDILVNIPTPKASITLNPATIAGLMNFAGRLEADSQWGMAGALVELILSSQPQASKPILLLAAELNFVSGLAIVLKDLTRYELTPADIEAAENHAPAFSEAAISLQIRLAELQRPAAVNLDTPDSERDKAVADAGRTRSDSDAILLTEARSPTPPSPPSPTSPTSTQSDPGHSPEEKPVKKERSHSATSIMAALPPVATPPRAGKTTAARPEVATTKIHLPAFPNNRPLPRTQKPAHRHGHGWKKPHAEDAMTTSAPSRPLAAPSRFNKAVDPSLSISGVRIGARAALASVDDVAKATVTIR